MISLSNAGEMVDNGVLDCAWNDRVESEVPIKVEPIQAVLSETIETSVFWSHGATSFLQHVITLRGGSD